LPFIKLRKEIKAISSKLHKKSNLNPSKDFIKWLSIRLDWRIKGLIPTQFNSLVTRLSKLEKKVHEESFYKKTPEDKKAPYNLIKNGLDALSKKLTKQLTKQLKDKTPFEKDRIKKMYQTKQNLFSAAKKRADQGIQDAKNTEFIWEQFGLLYDYKWGYKKNISFKVKNFNEVLMTVMPKILDYEKRHFRLPGPLKERLRKNTTLIMFELKKYLSARVNPETLFRSDKMVANVESFYCDVQRFNSLIKNLSDHEELGEGEYKDHRLPIAMEKELRNQNQPFVESLNKDISNLKNKKPKVWLETINEVYALKSRLSQLPDSRKSDQKNIKKQKRRLAAIEINLYKYNRSPERKFLRQKLTELKKATNNLAKFTRIFSEIEAGVKGYNGHFNALPKPMRITIWKASRKIRNYVDKKLTRLKKQLSGRKKLTPKKRVTLFKETEYLKEQLYKSRGISKLDRAHINRQESTVKKMQKMLLRGG